MDDKVKEELLRELLSDKNVRNTLKKILLEDEPKKSDKPNKPVAKKRGRPKKQTTENTAKVKKPTIKKRGRPKKTEVDKKGEYWRKTFVDDLRDKETVIEEIEGKEYNLVELSKKQPKINKPIRQKPIIPTRVCQQCHENFQGFGGYLCDKCLRGKNA